jgi:hypothetical protein
MNLSIQCFPTSERGLKRQKKEGEEEEKKKKKNK